MPCSKGFVVRFALILAAGFGAALQSGAAVAGSGVKSLYLEEKYVVHSGGVPVEYLGRSVPDTIEGSARLTLNIDGDLDTASKYVTVLIDNVVVGEILKTDGATCFNAKTVVLYIPAATLAPLIKDGKIDIALKPSNDVKPSCGGPCWTIRASGELVLYETYSPVEEKEISSSSLSKSRTTVTIASLPRLSKRLKNFSFQPAPSGGGGGSSGGGSPGGGLPGGGLPGGGLPGGGLPGGAFASGVTMSGGGTSSSGGFSFSGDLSGMRGAAAAQDLARRFAHVGERREAEDQQRLASGRDERGDPDPATGQPLAFDSVADPQSLDLWFGGSFSYFDTEVGGVGQTGGVGTLQMGVDARLSRDFLVGVAVFGDFLHSDLSTGSKTQGLGLMAGPYAVLNLNGAAYLEAMVAYGGAQNRISSDGLGDANYLSERVLVTGRLSGDMSHGAWTLRPSTRFTYYSERHDSFDAGDGSVVAADRTELGQARLGPEIAYDVFWDGGAMRPYVGVEGVWAFKQSDQVINGAAVAGEDLTASLSLGLDALFGSTSLRAAGRYDGVGDPSVEAVTGEITLRVPLQ